ncbi:hypothetical protein DRE_07273 [Drechslerella stenobrocha 248]|uniref:Beta-xylanase n=1 Tax=Drechslerella stenobrocha 248 TaxID=1043628 RepID=W7HL92_9PEZI|nr:hypothetical protein DRE_07273 [Drechslerella stenobrocha 248]
MKHYIALALAAPVLVSAQQSMWGQCGGIGWNGPTNCNAPASCSTLNPYYAQCLTDWNNPATSTTTSRTTTPVTTTTTTTSSRTTTTTTTTSRTTTTTTTTTTTRTTTSVPQGTGLNAAIRSKGKKYFGFCSDSNLINNGDNQAILKAEAGQLTGENSMKWESIQPNQGSYSWSGADTLVNFALNNNMIVRGHTFVWHQQIPQWLKNINNKQTLTSAIQSHIAAVAGRYKGKIYAWDVANEVFEDNGSRRSSVFSNVFNDWTFLDVAFNAAKAADPDAKLCLNDYNLDYSSSKLTNFVQLVKDLKSRNVPIDCVGTQSHLVVGNGAIPSYKSTLDSLATTNTEVQITELDIRTSSSPSQQQMNQQVTDYKTVATACMRTSSCSGITIWGVSDRDSWVPGVFNGEGYALLWDNNYRKKSAYQGFLDGINS